MEYKLGSGEVVVVDRFSHVHDGTEGYLLEALGQIYTPSHYENGRNFSREIKYDCSIGKSSCVATGPDDEIVFAKRPGRSGYSRFALDRSAIDSCYLTVALKKLPDGCHLETVFIGKSAPPEPWDRDALVNIGRTLSLNFWRKHALVWEFQKIIAGTKTTEAQW